MKKSEVLSVLFFFIDICNDLSDTDQRMSYKEHKGDNELEREPKQSSRKSTGSKKKV